MNPPRTLFTIAVAMLITLAGCATRPINPPIKEATTETGYTFQSRMKHFKSQENLVVLAFSGGGTRAAAFSYGVLEFLRATEVMGPQGRKAHLIDAVDMITGVSGGSFTALAYGLYGDKLFDDYEQAFLKRNVQGELIAGAFSPRNWGDLSSTGWGRSEVSARVSSSFFCSAIRRPVSSSILPAKRGSDARSTVSAGSSFRLKSCERLICG